MATISASGTWTLFSGQILRTSCTSCMTSIFASHSWRASETSRPGMKAAIEATSWGIIIFIESKTMGCMTRLCIARLSSELGRPSMGDRAKADPAR